MPAIHSISDHYQRTGVSRQQSPKNLSGFLKQTIVHRISSEAPEPEFIQAAAAILRAGGLVAFPTETVYGLGADAINPVAAASVFEAKGRPADNPLIVHIAGIEQARELAVQVPDVANTLVEKFWPGPLTLILKARDFVPRVVTGGLDTVAVRMPAHNVPRALIAALTHGMVGPSANLSGRPSPTSAQHVLEDFNGKIDMILDAGPTTIGLESTVIDVTVSPPAILRFGGVPKEEIEQAIGEVQSTRSAALERRSPGTRYRHYAPKARVVLIDERDANTYATLLAQCAERKLKIGEMRILHFPAEEYARRIFDSLRQLDKAHVDIILVESVPDKGIGTAVMDRLRRAADG